MIFTGERYVPDVGGAIRAEHLHRYWLAVDLVRGRDVLDVACGEGYGSFLLSQAARSVTGADVSAEVIEHARNTYHRDKFASRVKKRIVEDEWSMQSTGT